MSQVILSGKFSLGVQFLVGAIDVYALTLPRSREILLRDLLKLELFVQLIEFIFYAWMVKSWGKYDIKTVTLYRYMDWIITTPSMLITLMAFIGGSETQTLSSFVSENWNFISIVLSLNMLMLLFGIAGEMNHLPQKTAVALGFAPFILYFGLIYRKFIYGKSVATYKVRIFYYFLVVWSLYGVFALFPQTTKNTGYNILDLLSKNLFGIILYVIIMNRPVS